MVFTVVEWSTKVQHLGKISEQNSGFGHLDHTPTRVEQDDAITLSKIWPINSK